MSRLVDEQKRGDESAPNHVAAETVVVLPTYNGATYVVQQVESILAQTYRDFVLVIRDDASVDGTFELLRERYSGMPNVVVERNQHNCGENATVERVLRRHSATYFACSDQDDIWEPTKLESQIAQLEESGAQLCYSDLSVISARGEVVAASQIAYSGFAAIEGRSYIALAVKNCVHGCTIVARYSLLGTILPIPDGVSTYDRWFAAVAAAQGGITYCSSPLVRYRVHDGNTIGTHPVSWRGLTYRANRNPFGVKGYLDARLQERRAFYDAFVGRFGAPRRARVIKWFHGKGRLVRILGVPVYGICTAPEIKRVGVCNWSIDVALTALGPGGTYDE